MNTHPLRWSRSARLWPASLGVAAVLGLAACSSGASGTTAIATTTTGAEAMAKMAGMAGMAAAQTMPAAAPPAATSPASAAQAEVGILNFAFTPAKITIKAGQAVRWTNEDAVDHTVDFSGHISNVVNRGDTYTQTFTTPGTYHYICSIHPFMHGTVVVTS
jgi:plastocyanin